jgi:hypothetical protein
MISPREACSIEPVRALRVARVNPIVKGLSGRLSIGQKRQRRGKDGSSQRELGMAVLDEALSRPLLVGTVLVAGTILLRRLPDLPPNLRAAAISGLKLIAEAEFEMQDDLIGTLAEKAVEAILATMKIGKTPGEGEDAARRIIGNFEQAARARAHRHAWHQRDRNARYRHHVRKLRTAVARASHDLSAAERTYLSRLSAGMAEEW